MAPSLSQVLIGKGEKKKTLHEIFISYENKHTTKQTKTVPPTHQGWAVGCGWVASASTWLWEASVSMAVYWWVCVGLRHNFQMSEKFLPSC